MNRIISPILSLLGLRSIFADRQVHVQAQAPFLMDKKTETKILRALENYGFTDISYSFNSSFAYQGDKEFLLSLEADGEGSYEMELVNLDNTVSIGAQEISPNGGGKTFLQMVRGIKSDYLR